MSVILPQTVADWQKTGHRGLRIPRCPTCRTTTSASWCQLDARGDENIVAVAQRLRCVSCGEVPAGLPVVAIAHAPVQ